MRVLLVHRFYWPHVSHYAFVLKDVAERFAEDGHTVTVFSAQPSSKELAAGGPRPSPEIDNGVEVVRVRLLPESKRNFVVRGINMFLYLAALLIFTLRRRGRYDLMTVATTPPVFVGVAARAIRRVTGLPYLYHCQDLHPEIDVHAGLIRREGLAYRILRRLDTANCARARAVVTLSADMRDTIARRGVPTDHVKLINNFIISPGEAAEPVGAELRKEPGVFQVLFAGNMGTFQGLEHLVDAARLLRDREQVRFVFMGAGTAFDSLRERAGDLVGRNVVFVPHQPLAKALTVMQESDLAVVSLRPGVYQAAYPSKTTMYLEAGCRILAICEPESELAAMLEAEDLGRACFPVSAEGIAAVIADEAARDGFDRDRVRSIGRKYFGRDEMLDEWSRLLFELEHPA